MSLHALAEKWRAESDARSENAKDKNWAHWVRENEAGRATALRTCADELESALAGGGDAVARFRVINRGPVAPDMEFDWLADPLDIGSNEWTRLFTHPAGAVQVTEELVERVAWAIMPKMGDTREIEIATAKGDGRWKQAVETARTAISALNPGGSRE